MPELPEVQTVVDHLAPKLKGRIISSFEIHNPRTILGGNYKLAKKLKQRKILNVSRRAKYIVLKLSTGFILIHLRMTGRLMFEKPESSQLKHVTATIKLNRGVLYFKDTRRFGTIEYLDDLSSLEAKLGPEPLSSSFSLKYFQASLLNSKRIIKAFLLDQKNLAGLGNIYVDESLWYAGIHPKSCASKIPAEKIKLLHAAIKKVLRKSIKFNGTTFINFQYGEDDSGSFAAMLKVFDREDRPCLRCKQTIIKEWIAQRGSHYCLKCQQVY